MMNNIKGKSKSSRSGSSVSIRIFMCIVIAGVTLFSYIEKQNQLIELRLAIPTLSREVKEIHEKNTRLRYEIERFENPVLMMEVMRYPEYSHLRFPYLNEEIILPKVVAR